MLHAWHEDTACLHHPLRPIVLHALCCKHTAYILVSEFSVGEVCWLGPCDAHAVCVRVFETVKLCCWSFAIWLLDFWQAA